MVRTAYGRETPRRCFPHPRGDGPINVPDDEYRHWFSPPAWGWSDPLRYPLGDPMVFPTRVGMVRCGAPVRRVRSRFPHPRGDGPYLRGVPTVPSGFSPPAWGWSAACLPGRERDPVFPTRVGMVRCQSGHYPTLKGFPHPRGDGPGSF